ncbi:MAG TPA: hypothetical protein VHJ34_13695 [Actinomycetota bacterium]|nr:hypothetical protein [Actinomycetota bacterium]
MKLDELLEETATDAFELAALAAAAAPDGALLIGGSAADALATPHSDIDVFCFTDDASDAASTFVQAPGVTVHLHFVSGASLRESGDALRALATSRSPSVVPPALPYEHLAALHALDRGIVLRDDAGLDVLRTAAGSDLTSLYVMLRSLYACRAFASDAVGMLEADAHWAALSVARRAGESALDAALAAAGYVNPNPKWRASLAVISVLRGEVSFSADDVRLTLFPDASDPVGAVRALAASWAGVMTKVEDGALAGAYDVAGEASAALSLLRDAAERASERSDGG